MRKSNMKNFGELEYSDKNETILIPDYPDLEHQQQILTYFVSSSG